MRTDMNNCDGRARMQDLFTSYTIMLSRNGSKWLLGDNQTVALQTVFWRYASPKTFKLSKPVRLLREVLWTVLEVLAAMVAEVVDVAPSTVAKAAEVTDVAK